MPDAFEGLAEIYDRARPRYPRSLIEKSIAILDEGNPWSIVDAGAGTGIALETLLPLIPQQSRVCACDLSADMIALGKQKFPGVTWKLSAAESFLEQCRNLNLVTAAQSYQWMDRPRFLVAVGRALRSDGMLLIIQNNRVHDCPGFESAYEDLLEECSPGYSRWYRHYDVSMELKAYFSHVDESAVNWSHAMSVDEFIIMSQSSTQAQRAMRKIGPVFIERVRALAEENAIAGTVEVRYRAEAFTGREYHHDSKSG